MTANDTGAWPTTVIRRHIAPGTQRGPRLSGRHRPGNESPAAGGRRLIPAERRVPADYSPLDPWCRQRTASTYYAERAVHADIDQATATFDPSEVNQ